MASRGIVLLLLLAVFPSSGCFRHREAPFRPVTAGSMEEALADAPRVRRLVLNGRGLREAPAGLGGLPALSALYLRDNALTNFAGLAPLAGLEELDLSLNRMDAAPAELEGLRGLRRLYMAGCGLKSFPRLASPGALEYLNLDRNAIGSLPGGLPASLRWLRLNGNRLRKLPDSIGDLPRLQRLYLEGNRLSALPDAVGRLRLLEDIDLSGNAFSEFPGVLLGLPRLRNLDLRGNSGIRRLPDDIGRMKSLRTLVLARCPLSKEERARVRAALPECAINF